MGMFSCALPVALMGSGTKPSNTRTAPSPQAIGTGSGQAPYRRKAVAPGMAPSRRQGSDAVLMTGPEVRIAGRAPEPTQGEPPNEYCPSEL